MMKNKNLETDLFPLYKSEPPFMKFSGGYGYMGVILQSRSTGKIQCHFCGKLFKSVAKHAWHKHNRIDLMEYRDIVGLNKYTPLVCEDTSSKLRLDFINASEEEKEKRVKKLRTNNKKIHEQKIWNKRSIKGSVQYKNKFGTCDLQAKYYFWEEYKKLGKIPSNKEMSNRLRNLIYTRFRSYEDALLNWGITKEEINEHKLSGQQNAVSVRAKYDFFPKYDKKIIINSIKDFYSKNNRLPTWAEAKRLGFPCRNVFKRLFGTIKKNELKQLIIG
jgi:hypothetical protein